MTLNGKCPSLLGKQESRKKPFMIWEMEIVSFLGDVVDYVDLFAGFQRLKEE
jgi:hypothetical protein